MPVDRAGSLRGAARSREPGSPEVSFRSRAQRERSEQTHERQRLQRGCRGGKPRRDPPRCDSKGYLQHREADRWPENGHRILAVHVGGSREALVVAMKTDADRLLVQEHRIVGPGLPRIQGLAMGKGWHGVWDAAAANGSAAAALRWCKEASPDHAGRTDGQGYHCGARLDAPEPSACSFGLQCP